MPDTTLQPPQPDEPHYPWALCPSPGGHWAHDWVLVDGSGEGNPEEWFTCPGTELGLFQGDNGEWCAYRPI